MHDKLIYGKNETQRIVCIEPSEDSAIIYIEDENNIINSHIVSNRYWILSNQNIDGSFARLTGNLHYKYGKQFVSREDYISFKKQNHRFDMYSIHDPKESFMVKGFNYVS